MCHGDAAVAVCASHVQQLCQTSQREVSQELTVAMRPLSLAGAAGLHFQLPPTIGTRRLARSLGLLQRVHAAFFRKSVRVCGSEGEQQARWELGKTSNVRGS